MGRAAQGQCIEGDETRQISALLGRTRAPARLLGFFAEIQPNITQAHPTRDIHRGLHLGWGF